LGSSLLDKDWARFSVAERVGFLRKIAVLDTHAFLARISDFHTCEVPLLPSDCDRIMKLFKRIVEMFISSGKTDLAVGVKWWNFRSVCACVREHARHTSITKAQEFVLAHAEEYLDLLQCELSWAGSPEIMALANVIRRPFIAYGNDWISSDTVKVVSVEGGMWTVQPYLTTTTPGGTRESLPVFVFQVNGGGFYNMLEKVK